MDVQLISTTESWAQFAVAGPKSRDVLAQIVDQDISNDAFPFMACADITVCGGLPARLFRISFSGELAFEIAVPTAYGDALIRRIMDVGAPLGITPYGVETLNVLRIEKGHVTGNELDGNATAANLGMGRMVSRTKDSIGTVLSRRAGLNANNDLRLVGIVPVDPSDKTPAGAHLVNTGDPADAAHDQGHVTSACYSPNLGHHIALGFLKNGDNRIGDTMRLVSPVTDVDIAIKIVSPHFIDPQGDRLRA